MYEPTHVVDSADEVRDTLGPEMYSQVTKVIDHIDEHCRVWIERSPFVVISSAASSGAMDVSPKGDPPGFVKVVDPHTLAIPDRLGNHRGDTYINVIENPQVGLMFVVPNRREVVRVSGTARIVKDPTLLTSMAVNDKVPDMALLIRVSEAMYHCGKSMIRSNLWKPDKWPSIEGLPTYAQALIDHGNLDISHDDMLAGTDSNEVDRLY